MAEISIIAIPANRPTMGGAKLAGVRNNMASRAKKHGHKFINNFVDNGDLFARIKAILDADPNHCLKRLEINAHGNPGVCNGIRELTLSGFIRRYRDMKDRLCDQTHILLTGCNTGLKPRSGRRNSLAQRIATALPHDPVDFDIHLSVWGLAGYGLQGRTGMEKNMEIHRRTGRRRLYGGYPGGRDAKGLNSWNRFNNW